MAKGIKHPSPFKIKMGFDEALERFIGTKPDEVEALTNCRSPEKREWPGKDVDGRIVLRQDGVCTPFVRP